MLQARAGQFQRGCWQDGFFLLLVVRFCFGLLHPPVTCPFGESG